MPEKLHLTIARVDGAVFDGDVDAVIVPGQEGDMTILANHESFISPLKEGVVTIKNGEEEDQNFELKKGMIEVSDSTATVLI